MRVFSHKPLTSLLDAVILLYALVLAWYAAFGEFDLRPMGLPVYMEDWLKPYQIFITAIILRIFVYLLPGEIIKSGAASVFLLIKNLITRSKKITIIAAIVAFAVALRLWYLGQGVYETIYFTDAPDFIRAVWQYLKGDYLYETGYPHFSSHIVEWVSSLALWLVHFMDFDRANIDDSFIVIAARALNLVYTLGIFFIIYRMGGLLGQQAPAILAIFFLSVSTIHLQMSHYFINDFPMSFFAMIATYIALLNLKKERDMYYILAGVFTAIAFMCKYNAILTFVIIGFVYLHLHPERKDFTRNLDKLLKSILAFVAVYFILNPVLWVDPMAKYAGMMKKSHLMSRPRGLDMPVFYDFWLINHVLLLYYAFDYHVWVTSGLFHPMPMWLGLAAFFFAAFKYRRQYFYLWCGVLVMYLLGRVAKPNSVAYHYLNTIPIILFITSIGIWKALKYVPTKFLKAASITVLAVYLGYHAIQETSIWRLDPMSVVSRDWLKVNTSELDNEQVVYYRFKGENREAEQKGKVIAKFSTGLPYEQSYSIHRDMRFYFLFIKDKPLFFPATHFPTNGEEGYISPFSHELARTEKVFDTGIFGPNTKTRFIMASEASPKILVWVKNGHSGENQVWINAGCEKRELVLKPFETAVMEFDRDKIRSRLMYGKWIEMNARSERAAVWAIGTDYFDIGRIYLEEGEKANAVDAFTKTQTARGLLSAIAYADGDHERMKASDALEKIHPGLYSKLITNSAAPAIWKELAGYDDKLFSGRMTVPVVYTKAHMDKASVTPSGVLIPQGERVWGPYIPLMKGDYVVTVKWKSTSGNASYKIDMTGTYGAEKIFEKTVGPTNDEGGEFSVPFTIKSLVEYPVEIRFTDVKGGDLLIEKVNLRIDYLSELNALTREATGKIKKSAFASASGRRLLSGS